MIVMQAKSDTHKLVIEHDEDPWNPRGDSNLGTIVCYCGGKRSLGDRDAQVKSKDQLDTKYNVSIQDEAKIVLPLHMYDHGGVKLQTSPFRRGQGWDSTWIGFIYAYRQRQRGCMSDERIEEVLRGEVEMYNAYLNGEVYRYTLYELHECDSCGHVEEECVDSCAGFYALDGWSDLKDALRGNIPSEQNDLIAELEPTI